MYAGVLHEVSDDADPTLPVPRYDADRARHRAACNGEDQALGASDRHAPVSGSEAFKGGM
ncbi:MAG: hypothetical protein EXR69_13110 [Myxococcales bacterium]|nr:hypothetical protein [Myxococcales bacterium]